MDIDLKDASKVFYELAKLDRWGMAGSPQWLPLERVALAHMELLGVSVVSGVIGPGRVAGDAGTVLQEYALVEQAGTIQCLKSADVLDVEDLTTEDLRAIEAAGTREHAAAAGEG